MEKRKNELTNLIETFGESKTQLDEMDKFCKSLNAQIKEQMEKKNLKEKESENYVVKYWIETRDSMSEEKLLELFQSEMYEEAKALGIIKTKEYIDSDALENATYHGDITKDMLLKMDSCREQKEIPKLKVSKKK